MYDLNFSFAGPNSYTTNAQLPAIGVTNNFVCSQEVVGDVFGCTDPSALNYNPDANVDNGSCDYEVFGCTDPSALNYNPDANVDNGSCMFDIFGCMDMSANNYNPDATVDNGSCMFDIFGCTDPLALNHNLDATDDDGSCEYNHSECIFPPEFVGNTGVNMTIFLTSGVVNNLPISSDFPYLVALSPSGLIIGSASLSSDNLVGGQQSLAIWGDDTSTPNIDGALTGEEMYFQLVDGTLLYDVEFSFAGVNSFVVNGTLPALSVTNNFVCSQEVVGDVFGCTDPSALNYNPDANVDNGSCDFVQSSECPILDFTFTNTGSNMTLLFNTDFVESSDIQIGQMIGVFANTEEDDQTPICYGSSEWTGTQFSIAVWADDVTTTEIDGFQTGDTIKIGYQLSSGTILSLESSDIVFNPNAIEIISSGSFTEVCSPFSIPGCTDPIYLEYNPSANIDDGSCLTIVIEG